MHYRHLTEGNRTLLSRMMQAGLPIADVARIIGCHRSTLYRERRRNGVSSADINAYQPAHAHARAHERARQANARPRIEAWVYCQAYDYLENCDLSPARMRRRNSAQIYSKMLELGNVSAWTAHWGGKSDDATAVQHQLIVFQ